MSSMSIIQKVNRLKADMTTIIDVMIMTTVEAMTVEQTEIMTVGIMNK